MKATASPQDSVYKGREDQFDNCRRDGINMYIMESKLVWKATHAVLISGGVEMKDLS